VDLVATLEGKGAATGMPHGAELLALTDAVVLRDFDRLDACRVMVRAALGDAGLADTAATIGSYNAIVKVADATGIELDESTAEMTADMRTNLDLVDRKT
jgi:hypothetical protein